MKKFLGLGLIALISAGTSGCWWGWGHRDDGRGGYYDHGHEGHYEGHEHHDDDHR